VFPRVIVHFAILAPFSLSSRRGQSAPVPSHHPACGSTRRAVRHLSPSSPGEASLRLVSKVNSALSRALPVPPYRPTVRPVSRLAAVLLPYPAVHPSFAWKLRFFRSKTPICVHASPVRTPRLYLGCIAGTPRINASFQPPIIQTLQNPGAVRPPFVSDHAGDNNQRTWFSICVSPQLTP